MLEHVKQRLAREVPAVAACSQEESPDSISWPRSAPALILH
jgi:hypothetical protein